MVLQENALHLQVEGEAEAVVAGLFLTMTGTAAWMTRWTV